MENTLNLLELIILLALGFFASYGVCSVIRDIAKNVSDRKNKNSMICMIEHENQVYVEFKTEYQLPELKKIRQMTVDIDYKKID